VSIIHLNDREENGSAVLVTLPLGWTLSGCIAPSRNRAIQHGCCHLRANNHPPARAAQAPSSNVAHLGAPLRRWVHGPR